VQVDKELHHAYLWVEFIPKRYCRERIFF